MNLIITSFVLLFLSNEVQGAYLLYKSGQVDPAVFPSKACENINGRSPRIENINFGGAFQKVPSFISYARIIDIQTGNAIFTYTRSALTETNAQITITCPRTDVTVFGLSYYWFAFIDPRITVIDSGVIDVTGVSTRTFQYTYNNAYAKKGFINIQSVGYNGAQNFLLEVQTVSSTQADILFTAYTNYQTQIAFQVVIGPDDAFTIVNKQTGFVSSTPLIYNLANVDNNILFVPIYGYQLISKASEFFRYKQTITALTATNTQIQFESWLTSGFENVRYKEVQFNLKNYNVYYPFICAKMRVVKKQVLSVQPLKLYINEQSKTYLSGDSYTWQLDPGVQTLNIIASLKCPQRYKLVGYVLKCIDCIKDTYDLSTDCYGGAIDYVEHRIKLKQQDYVYQQLQIEVTDTSITITQLTLHPKSIILSLELIRK